MWFKSLQEFLRKVLDRTYFDSLFTRRIEFIVLLVTAVIVSTLIVLYSQLFAKAEGLLRAILVLNPNLIFLLTPFMFLCAWVLVHYIEPGASGSGIPQIMAVLEEGKTKDLVFRERLLGFRIAFVKVFSSCLAIIGGGVIGREGPSLHIAASLYYGCYKIYQKYVGVGNPNYWIIAGSASGLAAAFNTPLGGIMYAIEEVGQLHFSKLKTQLLFSIFVAGLISQAIVGPYLYVGNPVTSPLNLHLLAIISFVAFFNGYFAALVSDLLYRLMQKRNSIKSFKGNLKWILFVSLVVSLIVFIDKDSIGSGKEYMAKLLFDRGDMHGFTPILRILNNFLTYSVGLSGGVFAPALAAGAGLGYFLSHLFEFELNSGGVNLIILAGMISFLIGFTRSPLTSFVLVLEMTDKYVSISALLWVAIISYTAARLFRREGFYDLSAKRYISSAGDGR